MEIAPPLCLGPLWDSLEQQHLDYLSLLLYHDHDDEPHSTHCCLLARRCWLQQKQQPRRCDSPTHFPHPGHISTKPQTTQIARRHPDTAQPEPKSKETTIQHVYTYYIASSWRNQSRSRTRCRCFSKPYSVNASCPQPNQQPPNGCGWGSGNKRRRSSPRSPPVSFQRCRIVSTALSTSMSLTALSSTLSSQL